jgi:plasmid maintenance system antidote protein VapI
MYQRINTVFDFLKESKKIRNQQDFVERVGSDKSTVSQILNGKRAITKQFVLSVCKAFPFLSEEWIINGTGSMLLDESSSDKNDNLNSNNNEKYSLLYNETLLRIIESQQKTIEKLTDLVINFKH